MTPSAEPLLVVRDLRVAFGRARNEVLHGLSFTVGARERVGVIGESGSGKSVTALAVMGLLAENATVAGSVRLHGRELVGLGDRELSALRGDQLSMVFQEPMTALDPTMTVGRQVAEVLRLHQDTPHGTARERVVAMLGEVGLADPERVADAYPHALSGGQRQRCVLAMALINRPDLVICDEPTTALDVTVQARVVGDVFTRPRHSYTQGLVATARLDQVPPGTRLPTVEDFYARDAGGRRGAP